MPAKITKILFVVNSKAGPGDTSWESIINNYFTEKDFSIDFYDLQKKGFDNLKTAIANSDASIVVAVGGDGTVALVAQHISGSSKSLGIIPAGSANGMAKELAIPINPDEALKIIESGRPVNCDAIKINDKNICLHLSDIGLNARLIKYFDAGKLRGKLGYAMVLFKTLYRKKIMKIDINTESEHFSSEAIMVVIANASKYGTGAVINPKGKYDDGFFEIVIVRKLAFKELLRMMLSPGKFDPKNIQIIKARKLKLTSSSKSHFQIDGEYIGKVNSVSAEIIPSYIKVIL